MIGLISIKDMLWKLSMNYYSIERKEKEVDIQTPTTVVKDGKQ
tara:strand:+ start:476 stop:604 length:129 start_codon:yes stop_codon:yes gene_type:complete